MSGGKPCACSLCQIGYTSRRHFLSCLNTHRRLNLSTTVPAPVSHLLNLLSQQSPRRQTRQAFWSQSWPGLQQTLLEIDKPCHPDDQSSNGHVESDLPETDNFLRWITSAHQPYLLVPILSASPRHLTPLFPLSVALSPPPHVLSTDLFFPLTFQMFFLLFILPIL